MKSKRGFTLMELMIVVAILGIITALAFPSYMESVRSSNRADAKAALADASARMERCFTINNDYTDDTCSINNISSEEFYSINADPVTPTTFTITATAIAGTQLGDTDCLVMTLNNLGQRTPDDSYDCW